jgi:hypothetical protein
METSDRLRRRLDEMAEQLREEFGDIPLGEHGCLLEAVEDWAVGVGDQLARQMMTKQIAPQDVAAEESHCPGCCQMGRWKGQRKRRVETRRGPIQVSEPEYYCPRCRRSFFPADPRVGDGTGEPT